MPRKFIRSIVIIIIVIFVVFLSQHPYSKEFGRDLYGKVMVYISPLWQKASDWFSANVYPRISGEVAKRGEIAKEEINQSKEKIAQVIFEKIKNYFSKIIFSIFGIEQETQAPPSSQPQNEPPSNYVPNAY